MDDLAILISRKESILERIDISNNKITSIGAGYILRVLRSDKVLKRLNLSMNELNGNGLKDIKDSLKENKTLLHLIMSECKISDEIAVSIGEALIENKGLISLNLSQNFISDKGGFSIGQALLTNEKLKELDLNANQIGDQGCDGFIEALTKNTVIEGINFANNKLYDSSGQKLMHAITQNKQMKKLKLTMNSISTKYLNEIENCIKRNIARLESVNRTAVVSQFAFLKNELTKTKKVKKESELVLVQKKKLKEEIYEDVNILNDVQNNQDKGLDDLKQQLIDLADYEQKLDINIVEAEKELVETEKIIKKEITKQADKLNQLIDCTMLIENKVRVARKEYKDAEIQHRIELAEIKESLKNFKDKE